jgi:hypothetical protein
MFEYYNMRLGKFLYINGSSLNQLEPVLPEARAMELGIEKTGCPLLIRSMLESVRKQEVYN